MLALAVLAVPALLMSLLLGMERVQVALVGEGGIAVPPGTGPAPAAAQPVNAGTAGTAGTVGPAGLGAAAP